MPFIRDTHIPPPLPQSNSPAISLPSATSISATSSPPKSSSPLLPNVENALENITLIQADELDYSYIHQVGPSDSNLLSSTLFRTHSTNTFDTISVPSPAVPFREPFSTSRLCPNDAAKVASEQTAIFTNMAPANPSNEPSVNLIPSVAIPSSSPSPLSDEYAQPFPFDHHSTISHSHTSWNSSPFYHDPIPSAYLQQRKRNACTLKAPFTTTPIGAQSASTIATITPAPSVDDDISNAIYIPNSVSHASSSPTYIPHGATLDTLNPQSTLPTKFKTSCRADASATCCAQSSSSPKFYRIPQHPLHCTKSLSTDVSTEAPPSSFISITSSKVQPERISLPASFPSSLPQSIQPPIRASYPDPSTYKTSNAPATKTSLSSTSPAPTSISGALRSTPVVHSIPSNVDLSSISLASHTSSTSSFTTFDTEEDWEHSPPKPCRFFASPLSSQSSVSASTEIPSFSASAPKVPISEKTCIESTPPPTPVVLAATPSLNALQTRRSSASGSTSPLSPCSVPSFYPSQRTPGRSPNHSTLPDHQNASSALFSEASSSRETLAPSPASICPQMYYTLPSLEALDVPLVPTLTESLQSSPTTCMAGSNITTHNNNSSSSSISSISISSRSSSSSNHTTINEFDFDFHSEMLECNPVFNQKYGSPLSTSSDMSDFAPPLNEPYQSHATASESFISFDNSGNSSPQTGASAFFPSLLPEVLGMPAMNHHHTPTKSHPVSALKKKRSKKKRRRRDEQVQTRRLTQYLRSSCFFLVLLPVFYYLASIAISHTLYECQPPLSFTHWTWQTFPFTSLLVPVLTCQHDFSDFLRLFDQFHDFHALWRPSDILLCFESQRAFHEHQQELLSLLLPTFKLLKGAELHQYETSMSVLDGLKNGSLSWNSVGKTLFSKTLSYESHVLRYLDVVWRTERALAGWLHVWQHTLATVLDELFALKTVFEPPSNASDPALALPAWRQWAGLPWKPLRALPDYHTQLQKAQAKWVMVKAVHSAALVQLNDSLHRCYRLRQGLITVLQGERDAARRIPFPFPPPASPVFPTPLRLFGGHDVSEPFSTDTLPEHVEPEKTPEEHLFHFLLTSPHLPRNHLHLYTAQSAWLALQHAFQEYSRILGFFQHRDSISPYFRSLGTLLTTFTTRLQFWTSVHESVDETCEYWIGQHQEPHHVVDVIGQLIYRLEILIGAFNTTHETGERNPLVL